MKEHIKSSSALFSAIAFSAFTLWVFSCSTKPPAASTYQATTTTTKAAMPSLATVSNSSADASGDSSGTDDGSSPGDSSNSSSSGDGLSVSGKASTTLPHTGAGAGTTLDTTTPTDTSTLPLQDTSTLTSTHLQTSATSPSSQSMQVFMLQDGTFKISFYNTTSKAWDYEMASTSVTSDTSVTTSATSVTSVTTHATSVTSVTTHATSVTSVTTHATSVTSVAVTVAAPFLEDLPSALEQELTIFPPNSIAELFPWVLANGKLLIVFLDQNEHLYYIREVTPHVFQGYASVYPIASNVQVAVTALDSTGNLTIYYELDASNGGNAFKMVLSNMDLVTFSPAVALGVNENIFSNPGTIQNLSLANGNTNYVTPLSLLAPSVMFSGQASTLLEQDPRVSAIATFYGFGTPVTIDNTAQAYKMCLFDISQISSDSVGVTSEEIAPPPPESGIQHAIDTVKSLLPSW